VISALVTGALCSEMDDVIEVRRTAAEFVWRMGIDAVPHLREKAVIAAGMGDLASERAWLDIAAAAASLT
jgi:hypothetical protein